MRNFSIGNLGVASINDGCIYNNLELHIQKYVFFSFEKAKIVITKLPNI
jgi:hypothetical protein